MSLSILTFAMMTFLVVMTPGPTVLLALSNGSRFGVARAGYGIAGAALSDLVLMAAVALGLGALLAASALLFNLVKWIGVAYLMWLGVQMLRSSGGSGPMPAETVAGGPHRHESRTVVFRKSFLVAVTNPKGYLFFTAFLPQFIDLSQPLLPQYVILALVFVAIDIAAMTAYAGLGARAMRWLNGRGGRWIDRTCGGILIGMGAVLTLLRRSEA